jgi:hypothetical protein
MTRKRVAVLVVISGFIIGGFAAISIFNSQKFRLVNSTPKMGNTIPSSTGTIKLSFNRDLKNNMSLSTILVDIGERPVVQAMRIEGRDMFLSIIPLEEKTEYTIELRNITSTSNEVIPKTTFSFTPVYVPFDRLSSEQKALEASETDRDNAEDPLAQYLPYQGDSFYLTSEYTYNDQDESIFIVNNEAFLSASEVTESRSSVIERYESKVKSFIRSKGLDPSKYIIRTSLNEPVIRSD